MKKHFGFKTEDEEEHTEETDQETGYADSQEQENYSYWRDVAYPTLMDFFIIYGAYAAVRDIARSLLKRGGT